MMEVEVNSRSRYGTVYKSGAQGMRYGFRIRKRGGFVVHVVVAIVFDGAGVQRLFAAQDISSRKLSRPPPPLLVPSLYFPRERPLRRSCEKHL